nr:hypothetical protein [Burkholderia sp. Bp9140]
MEAETRVVRTSVGAMQVGTGSWHSPHGGASVEMQASSSGGMPPAARARAGNQGLMPGSVARATGPETETAGMCRRFLICDAIPLRSFDQYCA